MEIIGTSERYKAQKYDARAQADCDCSLQILLKPLLNKDNSKKKAQFNLRFILSLSSKHLMKLHEKKLLTLPQQQHLRSPARLLSLSLQAAPEIRHII